MSALIFEALRTPRGKGRADGGLAALAPQHLVTHLVGALESRGLPVRDAESMTLGSVGQVGAQGGHIAMVSKIYGDLPATMAVHSLNNFCASGLSAVGHAFQAIASGQARLALAGGVEMLSRVPFMGDKADYYTASDLPQNKRYIPVALAADLLAEAEGISRAELDEVALRSQQLSVAAEANPRLTASRVATNGLDRDEAVRPTDRETLAGLPPAFSGLADAYRAVLGDMAIDHRHTVGHAPPMADGAALALLGDETVDARARARILGFAEMGGDDRQSLLAGFAAAERALERADLTYGDMDRIEFMEAFGVVIAKFLRDVPVDRDRVNVGGGHIAKGHPMGATGAVLLSTLLDALDECDGKYGLVVATGAQGVGVAMVVERLA